MNEPISVASGQEKIQKSDCERVHSSKKINPLPHKASLTAKRIWLDVDIGIGLHRPILGIPIPFLAADPDDAYALAMAGNSQELDIQGLSTVCGNSNSIRKITKTAKRAVETFGFDKLRGRVFPGGSFDHRAAQQTAAVQAMGAALQKSPMTFAALGPLTNIAALIVRYPELVSKIESVVIIGGLRPHETPMLGRVSATDFNIMQDVKAAEVVFTSGVPLTLLPFELTSQVWLGEDDLDLLAEGPPALQWLAKGSRQWICNWRHLFGVHRGFIPFDTLAIGYLTHPDWFETSIVDATFSRKNGIRYGTSNQTSKSRKIRLCNNFVANQTPEDFRELILQRVKPLRKKQTIKKSDLIA